MNDFLLCSSEQVEDALSKGIFVGRYHTLPTQQDSTHIYMWADTYLLFLLREGETPLPEGERLAVPPRGDGEADWRGAVEAAIQALS